MATAIVTGAASGLGAAVARRLGAEGHDVALIDLDHANAQRHSELLTADGFSAAAFAADVSEWVSVQHAVAAAVERFGMPSLLVNAAAIQRFSHSHTLDPGEWQKIIGINLTGTFHMCRAVLPHMLGNDGGSTEARTEASTEASTEESSGIHRGVIVNIASTAGLAGLPYDAAYCAAKGGVIQMTKALAIEYSQRGIRVNAVAPGGMDTPMVRIPLPEGSSDLLRQRMRRSLLGVADPGDVANVVCFLLSDAARYMTGSVVVADGGSLA